MGVTYTETFESATVELQKVYNIFLYQMFSDITADTLYANGQKVEVKSSDLLRVPSYANYQGFPSVNFITIPNSIFIITDQPAVTLREAYKNPPQLIKTRHPASVSLTAPYTTISNTVDYGTVTRIGNYIRCSYPAQNSGKWLCIDDIQLPKIGELKLYVCSNLDVNHNLNLHFPSHQIQTYFGFSLYGENEVRSYILDFSFWRKYFTKRIKRKSGKPIPQYRSYVSSPPSYDYQTIVVYTDTPTTDSSSPSTPVFDYSTDAINPCD